MEGILSRGRKESRRCRREGTSTRLDPEVLTTLTEGLRVLREGVSVKLSGVVVVVELSRAEEVVAGDRPESA